MSIATDLLQQHILTLVDDPQRWASLIADDIEWELPYAPAIGHPLRLSGRAKVEAHVGWFRDAVRDFHFRDVRIIEGANPEIAVAEMRAEGIIKATGRTYGQEYVVFLLAAGNRIRHLREYFDPVRAAQALDAPILALQA